MALLVPPPDTLSLFQQNYLKAIRLFPGPLKRMDLGRWVGDLCSRGNLELFISSLAKG